MVGGAPVLFGRLWGAGRGGAPVPRERMGEASSQATTGSGAAGMSEDLRLALQRSEGGRLLVLLTIIVITAVSVVVRHAAGDSPMPGGTFVHIFGLIGVVMLYSGGLLLLVRRANARRRLLPVGLWVVTVVIETMFPSAAIVMLQRGGTINAEDALTSPGVLMYGMFIMLSILRMRPWLSALGGMLSAASHVTLVALSASAARFDDLTFSYYLSYGVNLLMTGVAASMVASQVRRYFLSSLREAEAKRSLDRMTGEMEIARAIQQRLLPKEPPSVAGFDIAGWNRPADQTGGDYYDWQMLPDGRVAVVIADVSGHGLGPALLMAVCRAYARACVPMGMELAAAFGRVNKLLCSDVGDGRFVTLAAVVLDGRTGECEMISAGHGPILLHRSGAAGVEVMGASGIPLGIAEDEEYGMPVRFTLEAGDSLLLVTDGFFEWARSGDGQRFGTARLAACMEMHAGVGAGELIERIEAAVSGFVAGAPQGDDMTAVSIRRVGVNEISRAGSEAVRA